MRVTAYVTPTYLCLPQMGLKPSTPFAVLRAPESGDAILQRAGNEHKQASCHAKHGDVESPWVIVKHGRCEPVFFAYFLCGGAKKVGAAPHRRNARAAQALKRMPAKKPKANKRRKTRNLT